MKLSRGNTAVLFASLSVAGIACLEEPAFAQGVSDKILSDVSSQSVGACSTITVNFNAPIQIQSFFPQSSGRELHIRLQPFAGAPNARESLRPPTDVPAIRSIEYEAENAAGPSLSLFFNRDIKFDVAAGKTPQSVVITITDPENTESCSAFVASLDFKPVIESSEGGDTAQQPAAASTNKAIPKGLYVVNIMSQPKDIGDLSTSQSEAVSGLVLYESRFERDGQIWHRLRAGFFETRDEAEEARRNLLVIFPDAWLVKVSAQERAQGVETAMTLDGQKVAIATPPTTASPLTPLDIEAAAKAEADAEAALKAGENDRAIALLTKALSFPENEHSPRALELLGLTRERKNQAAQARAEYEEYLRRYPSGEGADRVRQRLAAIDTGATATPELRQASGGVGKIASVKSWNWGMRGSFSQFYFREQTTNKFIEAKPIDLTQDPLITISDQVNLNQLLSNGDISLTGGNDHVQMLVRAAGSYTKDFRPKGRNVKTISALYFDVQDRELGLSARLGRQTKNSAGILGRFDGGFVGWQATPRLRLNAAAGYPVLSSRITRVETNRAFYGVSADVGSKSDKLQTTFYWFDQRSRGFVDRQAVGTEVRYLNKTFNAYAIVDYDVKYKKLNLGLLTLNYTLPDQSSMSVSMDYRQSPLLTTTNAIIGQTLPGGTIPILDLRDLKPFFTDPQIYQLAQERTLVAKSLSISYSRPISTKLQTNFDFTLTNTGGTPRSTLVTAGSFTIDAQKASGREYYYGAQLIGSGLIFANDIYILSGRYADTQTARTYTADINARVPVTSKLRISPRARYGFRDDKTSAATFWQLQPTLRINYYPIKASEIELEFGANFSQQRNSNGDTTKERGIVINAGYRLDF